MKTLKNFLYIAAIIVVCKIVLGFTNTAVRDHQADAARTTLAKPTPAAVQAPLPELHLDAARCQHYGKLAESIAKERDGGANQADLHAFFDIPGKVAANEKEFMHTLVRSVYDDPATKPADMQTLVEQNCTRAVSADTARATGAATATSVPTSTAPAQTTGERAKVCHTINELAVKITKDRDDGVPLDTWHQRIDHAPMTTDARAMFMATANAVYRYPTLTAAQLGDTLEEMCVTNHP